MADTVHCHAHGDRAPAFLCAHLTTDDCALGFHCSPPTDDNPTPDAWCNDCDIILQQHGGQWTDEAQKLVDIKLVCAGCYNALSASAPLR